MAQPEFQRTINRRDVLKLGGTLAAAGMVVSAGPSVIASVDPPPDRLIHLPLPDIATTASGRPPLPPLEVIALNRMAFGPRPEDLEALRALPGATPVAKLQAYVDEQLDPDAIDDQACDAHLAAANLVTLDKSLEQTWLDHVKDNPLSTEEDWNRFIQPFMETFTATFMRAVYSRRQLVEVLADFWHNHFNVYGWHDYATPVFGHYDRDVIRAHLLGNFRQMLEAVAKSPAMLYYLDNYTNQVAGPNENFARELFELHTLGAESYLGVRDPRSVPGFDQGQPIGYVDNDVYEAARCFTGWRVNDNNYEEGVHNTGTFLYYRPRHDRFNKIVLGKYLPPDQADMQDGYDVLDAVAAHPGTARHIARKLCRRLIADNPPEPVVDAATQVFLAHKDAPDQLKQVVRTILLSEEFRSTWGEKIKRPFEAAISMLRALNVELTPFPLWAFDYYYAPMGQPLFQHHAPDGYADLRDRWANTMSMLHRWKFCNALIDGWIGDETTVLTVNLLDQMPATLRTPNAIADFWIERLLGRPMFPTSNRAEIVQALAQDQAPSHTLSADEIAGRLPFAIKLILMAPDFQWR